MPQKYGKNGKTMPGFRPDAEKLKDVSRRIDARRQKDADKKRRRKFLAEPEELAVLDTLAKMPNEAQRLGAAEGLLIARVARRKKLIK